MPLLQVNEWLGHSTITMTMRYAHLAPGGGTGWINVLEPALLTGTAVRVPYSRGWRGQFYKSMTTIGNSAVWQDVYHVAEGYLVISFKEK